MSIRQGDKVLAGKLGLTQNLFDFKWSDHILNDAQWLRADTFSWQDGELYEVAYNHLLDEWNETGDNPLSDTIEGITVYYRLAQDGHKICTASQEDEVLAIYNATGVAWYYIIDTENTRFKLPRTKFGFVGLRDTVGNYAAPGLPNITGYLSTGFVQAQEGNGAFSVHLPKLNRNIPSGSDTYQSGWGWDFSASDSNTIYGASTTVQSPATQMYLYFYVGEFKQTAIENTAGLNTELFNEKVDLDLSNLSATGKEKSANLAMPSDRYIDLTLGVSGTEYVAPADGYVSLAKASGTSGAFFNLFNKTKGIGFTSDGYQTGNKYLWIPVVKGDKFTISYTFSGSTTFFRFIYANGAQ